MRILPLFSDQQVGNMGYLEIHGHSSQLSLDYSWICTFALRNSNSHSEGRKKKDKQKKTHPVDDRSEGTSYVKDNMFYFLFSYKNILLAHNTASHFTPQVPEASCYHLCLIFNLLTYVRERPLEISSWLCFKLHNSNGSMLLNKVRAGGSSPSGLHECICRSGTSSIH